MAVDDPHRLGGIRIAHRDARFAERTEAELKQPWRRARRPHRLHAMTVEERLDHIGLDVGHGPEDDGQPSVGHAAASVDASIFNRIIVISSCWSALPAKARSSARMYERN